MNRLNSINYPVLLKLLGIGFFCFINLSTFYTRNVKAEIQCHDDRVIEHIDQCDIFISANSMQRQRVYLKSWVPDSVNEKTPVILFLHGRGYAKKPTSTEPTMIESAGLKDWMASESYNKFPAIVISPQDLFVRGDGTGVGNDYWIGFKDRDWESFLINELKPFIKNKFSLNSKRWLVAGISMGAHGAMKLTMDYPKDFAAFVSLSPVFRSTKKEIFGPDKDVFYKFNSLKSTSMGNRFLVDERAWEKLARIPHWIEIHEKDFALGKGFEDSKAIWEKLDSRSKLSYGAVNPINRDKYQRPGHSMEYWKSRMPSALDWLVHSSQNQN